MESTFKLALVFAAIFAFYDTVEAQGPECTSMNECMGEDYERVILEKNGDVKDTCRVYREVLECMDKKKDACLASLPDKSMMDMFLEMRDSMVVSQVKTCKEEGEAITTGLSCMEKCQADVQNMANFGNDLAKACPLGPKVLKCLREAKCPDNLKTTVEAMITGLEKTVSACDTYGAAKSDECNFMKCLEDGEKPTCKHYKCVMDKTKKCKDKAQIESFKSNKDIGPHLKELEEKCKGSGSAMITPSLLAIFASAILMTFGFRF